MKVIEINTIKEIGIIMITKTPEIEQLPPVIIISIIIILLVGEILDILKKGIGHV